VNSVLSLEALDGRLIADEELVEGLGAASRFSRGADGLRFSRGADGLRLNWAGGAPVHTRCAAARSPPRLVIWLTRITGRWR
jgi:hypothetical protein